MSDTLFLILLLGGCALMHLFMHRGHGHHRASGPDGEERGQADGSGHDGTGQPQSPSVSTDPR